MNVPLAQTAGILSKENVGDLAELLESALEVLLSSIEDDVADEGSVAGLVISLNGSLLGGSGGSLGLLSLGLLNLLSLLVLGSLLGVEDTRGLREEADGLDSAGDESSAGNAGGERSSRSLGGDGPRSREGGSDSGAANGLHFEKGYEGEDVKG